jgi:hypothetical protein
MKNEEELAKRLWKQNVPGVWRRVTLKKCLGSMMVKKIEPKNNGERESNSGGRGLSELGDKGERTLKKGRLLIRYPNTHGTQATAYTHPGSKAWRPNAWQGAKSKTVLIVKSEGYDTQGSASIDQAAAYEPGVASTGKRQRGPKPGRGKRDSSNCVGGPSGFNRQRYSSGGHRCSRALIGNLRERIRKSNEDQFFLRSLLCL